MKVLAVVAHPDDETIGCGGTLAKHAKAGHEVRVQWYTDGISSRKPNDGNAVLRREAEADSALRILGAAKWYGGSRFYDQQMDEPGIKCVADDGRGLLAMVQPDIVYTHWPHDLNQDHAAVARAVLIATRTWNTTVRRLLAFEVQESTGQSFGLTRFVPTSYVDITDTADTKCAALACYASERREPPHPRSDVMVRAQAAVRGSEAGVRYAEAFALLREVWL